MCLIHMHESFSPLRFCATYVCGMCLLNCYCICVGCVISFCLCLCVKYFIYCNYGRQFILISVYHKRFEAKNVLQFLWYLACSQNFCMKVQDGTVQIGFKREKVCCILQLKLFCESLGVQLTVKLFYFKTYMVRIR